MAKSKPRPKVAQSFGLPEPDEINKAVEAVTTGEVIDGQKVIEHKPPTPPKKQKVKTVGRPPATHGRKRTSVMVEPTLWRSIKMIALQKDLDISDVLHSALDAHVKKHLKK